MNNNKTKAFTLMEALISIAIMLMAVVSAMSLATQSIKTISITRQRMVASMLARESMELVRNKRDSNFLEMLNDAKNETNKNYGGWMAGLLTPEAYGGDRRCYANLSKSGCVAQIDPVPMSKASEKLVSFHKCTSMSDDTIVQCFVVTNGKPIASGEEGEDICEGQSPCNYDAKYGYLYRNMKYDADYIKKFSIYKRRIIIEKESSQPNCEEMAKVKVFVKWNDRFGGKTYIIEDHLYNWVGKGLLDDTTGTPCPTS